MTFDDQLATVDEAHSLLCVYHETFTAAWNLAVDDCYTFYDGAHLCSGEELMRACAGGVPAFAPIASSWLSDRLADNAALYVNAATCGDFDGSLSDTTALSGKYCCLEWPKY